MLPAWICFVGTNMKAYDLPLSYRSMKKQGTGTIKTILLKRLSKPRPRLRYRPLFAKICTNIALKKPANKYFQDQSLILVK